MRRSGILAIFLVIVICAACVGGPVLAADSSDTEAAPSAVHSAPALTIPGDVADAALPSGDPSEDIPTESQVPSDEPTETPLPTESQTPAPSSEPTDSSEPSEEPSQEPTEEPIPTAEPTASVPAQILAEAPSLEMSAGQTIYLNQETPSIKIKWKNGIPDTVAGYVWSFSTGSASRQVFYVTYDPNSTSLAAGALNGHVNSAGTYRIWCQPVDADQEPAAGVASIELYVEASECELTISASHSMPVAAGSQITLNAHTGNLSSQVSRYEWKPSGAGSGGSVCKVESVAAGPVRYTCTAVLKSGQRITGTLVVTGTELIASQRSITLGMDAPVQALSVAWSNGTPDGSIRYRWSVRGESSADLSAYYGMTLPTRYLSDLKSRSNPYTISCQPYIGAAELGSPATMQVRVSGDGIASQDIEVAKTISGNEYGKAPDTQDESYPVSAWIIVGIPALLPFILLRALKRSAHKELS